jgi:Skp family chaperone for outer membrane proteins
MSIFEKMFGGPREVVQEMQEKEPEIVVAEEPKPKTLEDIKEVKVELAEMADARQDLLEKHRNTSIELKEIGVQESQKDSSARTETYNDLLNPIEEDLQKISAEILQKRAEFDLQPDRTAILENRMKRLKDLEQLEEEAFLRTEDGQKYQALKNKILELNTRGQEIEKTHETIFEVDNIIQETRKVEEQKHYLGNNSAVVEAHFARLQKIAHLVGQLDGEKDDILKGDK